MTFHDDVIADRDEIIFNTDEFAVSVTYNGTPIDAIFGEIRQGASGRGSVMEQGRLTVKTSDVASPTYRDTVIIAGVTWKVFRDETHQIEGGGLVWRIPVYVAERPIP